MIIAPAPPTLVSDVNTILKALPYVIRSRSVPAQAGSALISRQKSSLPQLPNLLPESIDVLPELDLYRVGRLGYEGASVSPYR